MARHTSYRGNTKSASLSLAPLVELWLFRLLVPLGGHQDFIRQNGFKNDLLAKVVNLGDWIDIGSGDFDTKEALIKLRQLHADAERKYRHAKAPTCLADNVERLAKLVGLSDTDCRVLELAAFVHTEQLLDDVGDWLGEMSSPKLIHALAVLLDLPDRAVNAALSPQGLLAKSGLLTVERSGTASLRRKLNLLSDSFADLIITTDADPITLLRETVALASPAQLGISDFDHVAPMLSVLRPYLRHSLATGRRGVNLFVHGSPGTGKSQLAKVLAQELACELFEVASEDSDGDPVNGASRLRAFRAGQSFFSSRRAIMVFDEAEDVFNDGDTLFNKKSTAQLRKAWVNRMLEDNTVPTIWLSNEVNGMDPAFIRRFDMVFELPLPPKNQRERIIRKSCAGMLDDASIARLAESDRLAPAVVTKAAAVVGTIAAELGATGAASALEMLIGNTLQAQGHRATDKHDPNRLPDGYDPAFIHADTDLAQIPAGLLRSKSGRICLYGPPGTGKTAFARWLARQMDAPLIVKRASDLMSKYVGDNEKNVASAFKQAEQDGAVLLIDEVDSFLQDRRGSKSSWEVSLVNEMLTQMEAFPGVFIASTNLMSGLDQAALRRFDLKVKFDFLKSHQSLELFRRTCAALDIPVTESDTVRRLTRLSTLTPGDFASVGRRHRFRPITCAMGMVAALEAECVLKGQPTAVMGFL